MGLCSLPLTVSKVNRLLNTTQLNNNFDLIRFSIVDSHPTLGATFIGRMFLGARQIKMPLYFSEILKPHKKRLQNREFLPIVS